MQNLNLESRSISRPRPRSRHRSRSRYSSRYRSRPENVLRFSGSFHFMLLFGVAKAHGITSRSTIADLDQGFNASETSLKSLAGQAGHHCTKEEYESGYMCAPDYDIGSSCVRNHGLLTFDASISRCTELSGYLLEIKNDYEQQRISFEVQGRMTWLGMKLINGVWRWKRNNKKVEYFRWRPGKPNKGDDRHFCAVTRREGWEDMPCDWELLTYCHERTVDHADDYEYRDINGTIEPYYSNLRYGEEFEVRCSGYYMALGYLFVQVDTAEGDFKASYTHEDKCGSQNCTTELAHVYDWGDWKCVRLSMLKVTLKMTQELSGLKFTCGIVSRNIPQRVFVRTLYYSHEPSKPTMAINDPDLVVEIGQRLAWTCHDNLGTGSEGSLAVISFYDCGNWVWEHGFRIDGSYSAKSANSWMSCASLHSVESKNTEEGGNVLLINAEVEVTDYLEGAILACFSYGAIKKFETEGLRKDDADTLALYSTPIKITYKPAKPHLSVKYHAQPQNIYRNVKLWAVCDAQVGTGGGIMWTLKSSTGREEFRTELGGEPPETPPNIEIDTFPKTCPENWVGCVASGTCIKVSEIATSWEDARRVCQEENSDLVRILNYDTFGFLNSILGADGYWFGLNDLDGDGKFNWPDNTRFMANHSGWATLVERTVNPPDKTCVYMHGRKWYTHGCQYRLRSVCETAPGSYFSDEKYVRGKKPEMRSLFTVIINSSLDSATLECQVTSPTINTDGLKDESMPFTLVDSPVYSAEWLKTEEKQTANLNCAADVAKRIMSIAVFSRKELKYLYLIDTEKVVESVRPAAKFEVTEFKVLPGDLDRIMMQATLETDGLLEKPLMICFPYAVGANETFYIDADFTQARNKKISITKPESADVSIIVLFLFIAAAFAVAVLLSSKGSGKPRPDKGQEAGGKDLSSGAH